MEKGCRLPMWPKLSQSREWSGRSARVVPGRAQTFSKGPLSFVEGVTPSFLRKASGALVWDVDGNEYIDYILGLGPVILGHAHPAVNRAVAAQLEDGIAFSLPHPLEVELSELLCEIVPCAEMVRFGKNGSDATSGAIRLARAITGRDKVARCGYHGWQDWYIGSTSRHAGVPQCVRDLTVPFPYANIDALQAILRQGDIACVVMEPVTFDPPPDGYLEAVRDLCTQHAALLIFDEVITGFRLHLGGAQAMFKVTPDLACFGKAMANGFPLSAIVGKADYMRRFEEVFFSFTFGGEALSLAASIATIETLRAENGIDALWQAGTKLKDGTIAAIRAAGLAASLDCAGLAPWTTLRCLGDAAPHSLLLRSLFQQECAKRRILTHGNHMLSVAHNNEIIGRTLATYAQVFPILADAIRSGNPARWLEGPPMQAVIRQT
jgi:glutamate-1-semialdehyde aminotransferase